jgi:ADP-ribose pyrophosphatase YjhB (NUDIX family)
VTATQRLSVKVLLVDAAHRVLLFCSSDRDDPTQQRHWFPPGGGVEHGESLQDAAVREITEEVGITLRHDQLGPVVRTRHVVFRFDGQQFEQDEHYFVVLLERTVVVSTSGWTPMERRMITAYRWWPLADLPVTAETVYPEGLHGLVEQALRGTRPRALGPRV